MSDTIEQVIAANFDEKTSKGLVLIDFYADWCGPCRMMSPVIDELATELSGQVTIVKFDVDSDREIPARFNVSSIPTFVLLKDGVEVERVVGIKDKEGMKGCLTPHMG